MSVAVAPTRRTELTAIPASTPPVVTRNGVVVDDDRTLTVYDKETGDRRRELYSFTYDGGKHDITAVGATDGTVFAASQDGVVAVNSDTGSEQWRRDDSVGYSGICVGTETVVLPLRDPGFSPYTTTISALNRESNSRV